MTNLMKSCKIMVFVLLSIVLGQINLLAVYEIGDTIEDFTWLESDGGAPVERGVHQTIDDGKALLLFYGGRG